MRVLLIFLCICVSVPALAQDKQLQFQITETQSQVVATSLMLGETVFVHAVGDDKRHRGSLTEITASSITIDEKGTLFTVAIEDIEKIGRLRKALTVWRTMGGIGLGVGTGLTALGVVGIANASNSDDFFPLIGPIILTTVGVGTNLLSVIPFLVPRKKYDHERYSYAVMEMVEEETTAEPEGSRID